MNITQKKYLHIVSHYESCLEKYGDTHLGVDWPNQQDVETRYRVMLEVMKQHLPGKVTLLDFGCGASHLYQYILEQNLHPHHKHSEIEYSGLDLSDKFVQLSQKKFPSNNYYCLDIMEDSADLPEFDYIVMNGVFTEKRELSFDEMMAYFQNVISKVFSKTRIGIAFNVMSKQVDWERDDLFHLPFDVLASFLTENISRNFTIRHDYRLYEYTTYVYK
ncbi:MAG: class I SAM-dependent methyltransferase [Symploca sp. SIO1A3]|nr:class I SAM-dependent methyltransferase [Symploca sp. SIO1A3]